MRFAFPSFFLRQTTLPLSEDGLTQAHDYTLHSSNTNIEATPLIKKGQTLETWHYTTRIVVYMIALSEGLSHLAALAIYYLFKDDLHLNPSSVSLILTAPTLPWIARPLFAFCSDSYPIFGYRRKPYIMIFGTMQILGFVSLAVCRPSILTSVLSLFTISLAASFCSAVAEALLAESTVGKPLEKSADNISEFLTAKAIGSLMVAYLSGYLLEAVSKQTIFLVTAIFPSVIVIACLFMQERTSLTKSTTTQLETLLQFLKKKVILGPIIFILMYMAGPDYDDAIFFFYTGKAHFSPSFMGTLRFTYGVASLVGIAIYYTFLRAASFRSVLIWSILLSIPFYISPIMLTSGYNKKLGISDKIFVLSGGFLVEATAEIQMLPLLVMAATICPPGLEGSVYATTMSVRNVASAISRLLSAIFTHLLGITATNFKNIDIYILLCGAFLIIPLIFISLVPTNEEIEAVKKENEEMREESWIQNDHTE